MLGKAIIEYVINVVQRNQGRVIPWRELNIPLAADGTILNGGRKGRSLSPQYQRIQSNAVFPAPA